MEKMRLPFFVTTDNENKMKAAFDGRYEENKQWKFGGRVGCTEHALSTCVTYCMESEPKGHADAKLKSEVLDKINAVENFYNRREDKAKRLICAIPEKSGTRPWRSHYHRLKAANDNYTVYLTEDNEQVTENLPSLATLKSVLSVVSDVKTFFDRVEVEGVTSHLSFLNYLVLDLSLFNKETDSSQPSVCRNLCKALTEQMEEKLWAYCGSPFSQSAAFLTGVDIAKKIKDYMAQFMRCSSQPQKGFCASWLQIAADHDALVDKLPVKFVRQLRRDRK